MCELEKGSEFFFLAEYDLTGWFDSWLSQVAEIVDIFHENKWAKSAVSVLQQSYNWSHVQYLMCYLHPLT